MYYFFPSEGDFGIGFLTIDKAERHSLGYAVGYTYFLSI
jgi:hypothetical protein